MGMGRKGAISDIPHKIHITHLALKALLRDLDMGAILQSMVHLPALTNVQILNPVAALHSRNPNEVLLVRP